VAKLTSVKLEMIHYLYGLMSLTPPRSISVLRYMDVDILSLALAVTASVVLSLGLVSLVSAVTRPEQWGWQRFRI